MVSVLLTLRVPLIDLRAFYRPDYPSGIRLPSTWSEDKDFVRYFGPVTKRYRGPVDPWAAERAFCRYDRVLRFPPSYPGLLSRDVPDIDFFGIKRRLYPASTRNDLFHADLQIIAKLALIIALPFLDLLRPCQRPEHLIEIRRGRCPRLGVSGQAAAPQIYRQLAPNDDPAFLTYVRRQPRPADRQRRRARPGPGRWPGPRGPVPLRASSSRPRPLRQATGKGLTSNRTTAPHGANDLKHRLMSSYGGVTSNIGTSGLASRAIAPV
jgi:hypothetical protein